MTTTFLFSSEISAFGAGNIDSNSAYGLSGNDQVILQNKKKIESLQATINTQQEAIDGLRSVVDSLNAKIAVLENSVADLQIRVTGKVSKPKASKSTTTLNKPASNIQNQQSKEKPLTNSNKKVVSFDDMKISDIKKEASNLYNQKRFQEAKANYEYLINKKQDLGNSYFMLGQIYFSQKSYPKAIENYKKSISKDKNAEYLPELLLNTAKSLEKVGENKNAQEFYKVLTKKYPNSKQAKNLTLHK